MGQTRVGVIHLSLEGRIDGLLQIPFRKHIRNRRLGLGDLRAAAGKSQPQTAGGPWSAKYPERHASAVGTRAKKTTWPARVVVAVTSTPGKYGQGRRVRFCIKRVVMPNF